MNKLSIPSRLASGLLFLIFSCSVSAEGGFLGFGGDEAETPSLTLVPAEIALDVPTPVQGEDLALLLAQAGSDNGLSAMKEKAARKFTARLQRELYVQLQAFFTDEEVPIVQQDGYLTLHNFLDISVGKKLNALKNTGGRQLERGTVELGGDYHYRLENPAGKPLREGRIDIAELRVREKYRVSRSDGEVEDNTDAAIDEALAEMVERLLDRIEDDLEADELRALAAP